MLGARWQRPALGGRLDVGGYALTRSLENPIPPVIIDLERRAGGMRAAYRRGSGVLEWTAGLEAGLQHDDRLNHENDGGERAQNAFGGRFYEPGPGRTLRLGLRAGFHGP